MSSYKIQIKKQTICHSFTHKQSKFNFFKVFCATFFFELSCLVSTYFNFILIIRCHQSLQSFRENYLPAKDFTSYQNQWLIPILHLTNDDSKGNLLSVLLVALLDFSFVIYYNETIKIPLLLINDCPTEFSLIILPEW